MNGPQSLAELRAFEIPSRLVFEAGGGGWPKANITTPWSRAEIYLHGAHVAHFQKTTERPLLFLSRQSRFAAGKPIRGGVPICYPWFGPREGDVAHGFARISAWELRGAQAGVDGSVELRFGLPIPEDRSAWSALAAEYIVTVADHLVLEFVVTNRSSNQNVEFEECLHTYLHVGDIRQVTITGLQGALCLDQLQKSEPHPTSSQPLVIAAQTDRTYLGHTGAVEIRDGALRRRILVEKSGSASTVVWNPWTTQPLADFGPDEYLRMVCVESGNVNRNRRLLAPGRSSQLRATLRSAAA